MGSSWWTPQLNAVLGSLVVTVGFWIIWGAVPIWWSVAIALVVAGFLAWQATTIGLVWAWSTLLLGCESLAWPIATMVQVRSATSEPTDEQMGEILNAVLFGLFSSVFWISFAYGLFKRARRPAATTPPGLSPPPEETKKEKSTTQSVRR